jgi:ribosomal protein L20A (L18A)
MNATRETYSETISRNDALRRVLRIEKIAHIQAVTVNDALLFT